MDSGILKIISQNKEMFVPLIFTQKQFSILERYSAGEKLGLAEKKSLYTSITRKIKALGLVQAKPKDNFYIKGGQYLSPDRIVMAKEIINKFPNEQIFIAGSFLFSKKYRDIDIYILRERGYKEIQDQEKHLIYLTRKKLADVVFQSAALISVSNFENTLKPRLRKIFLHQLMSIYHEAVIEYLQNDEKKDNLRELIFHHNLICQHKLINALEIQEIMAQIKINQIDEMFTNLCKSLFSKTYLYVEVLEYIRTLKESIKNIKQNFHLEHYKNTYEELIYGRKNPETKAC